MQRRSPHRLRFLAALCLGLLLPLLALTLVEKWVFVDHADALSSPTPTPPPFTPQPLPSPTPILTAKGPPPHTGASAVYLLDADTNHVLADVNGERTLPMASTTKIMTALIAIQTGNLNQTVTIGQDAYNEVVLYNGSSANLVVGDHITLRDLLYGLMLPSGDDAAIAIADVLAQSPANFVVRMNLFAHRLHLYQTHYSDPDGLTPDGQTKPYHYTSAADLTHLTEYAMSLPLFTQIVATPHYTLAATAQHHAYTWDNTNQLLRHYNGANGVKTGYTQEAGYCLVFSAARVPHHLIGVVLHDSDSDQRFADAEALLSWGFSLPLLPPPT